MTTSQMNAEIFRSLSILAESEEMLARAAKYLRKLAQEQQQKSDPTLMSKEEFFRKLDEAEEEYNQGKYISFKTPEEMNEWLNSL